MPALPDHAGIIAGGRSVQRDAAGITHAGIAAGIGGELHEWRHTAIVNVIGHARPGKFNRSAVVHRCAAAMAATLVHQQDFIIRYRITAGRRNGTDHRGTDAGWRAVIGKMPGGISGVLEDHIKRIRKVSKGIRR